MAKSNKPVVWGLFAAGGTVVAFILPALVLLTLLPALGVVPTLMTYDGLHAVAAHWLGKIAVFVLLFLAAWHAAHRLRITLHDLGLRADAGVAVGAYVAASAASVSAAYLLWRI